MVVNSLFVTVAVKNILLPSLPKPRHSVLRMVSDIIIRGLSLGLPEPDLQRDKCSHGHVKEKLPEVAQFIEIHVAQTDEAKSQKRLDIPPAGVVDK